MTEPIIDVAGILLPVSVLHSGWFAVLAAFVALNTVIYVSIALMKIFPAPRWTFTGATRRSETRSIYPDGPI